MRVSNNPKKDLDTRRKLFLVFAFFELFCLFFSVNFYYEGDFGKMYMDMLHRFNNVDNISALFSVPENLQALRKMKTEEDGIRVAEKVCNLEKNKEYGELLSEIKKATTHEKMNAVLEKLEKLPDKNEVRFVFTKQETIKSVNDQTNTSSVTDAIKTEKKTKN